MARCSVDGAWVPPSARRVPSRTQIIVMGMSRSGSSLTTSLIASLLPQCPQCWRGSGRAYLTDLRNPLGYFERSDVVRLNYELCRHMYTSWTDFPADFLENPTTVNFSSLSTRGQMFRYAFERRRDDILADMQRHVPWVLKDVRFARTLHLWYPRLSSPACIIPFRNPLEVASSSIMHSSTLWRDYMVSALQRAYTLRCPTLLVNYESWITQPQAQYHALWSFLRTCVSLVRLPTAPSYESVMSIVKATQKHHEARRLNGSDVHRRMLPSTACVWRLVSSPGWSISSFPQLLTECRAA